MKAAEFNSEIQKLVGASFMAGRSNVLLPLITKCIKPNSIGDLMSI
jgi:hypothetical protein